MDDDLTDDGHVVKKVLFLNLYDDPADGGGVEVTLQHLTQGLTRRGVEPVMLSTDATPGLHQLERHGVRIWRAGLRNLYSPGNARPGGIKRVLWHAADSYNLGMQPLLRRVLDSERPDVVSIHNLPGWSAAAWRTLGDLNYPAVQVLHDAYAICPKSTMFKAGRNCAGQCLGCRALRLPHRRLSNQVRAVVGVSRYILDRHLGLGYFNEVPIRRLIHNARDAQTLGVDSMAKPRNSSTPFRFGFIGLLDSTKGVEYLLELFSGLQLPDTELWVAGSGQPDYEQRLRRRFSSPCIRFLGRVPQKEFYPQVDAVVVPSLWNEPLGMVVAEALAFGKPVIGTRRGGIPEMVVDGENGLLVEPDRPAEFAAALQRLRQDAGLRARMTAHARPSAAPFLDREAWVSHYLGLYQEIAETSGRIDVREPKPFSDEQETPKPNDA